MASEFPLSLIIRAVDKATGPLRLINQRINKFTAPVRKLSNSFKALSDEAGLPRLVKGFRGVGSSFAQVGEEAVGLGLKIAAMAAGAGYAFYSIVRGAVDAGDKLGEMAQRVGLSVDAYAQLQFAAAQADVEQEAFNGAMDQFNKRLGEAKAGGGPLLDFLNKVNPAFALQVKGAKSTEEAFGLMTGAFERVTDPGKRAALAAAAFGKSGLQMGQFLGQGTAAIEEQRRAFFALNGSQEGFVKNAGELDNTLRRTEVAFGGLRNMVAGALFPAITDLANAVTELIVSNGGDLRAWAQEAGAAIKAWVADGGVQRLAKDIRVWGERIAWVIEKLGGLDGVLKLVGLYLASGFIGAVGGAVSALWTFGAAVIPMVTSAALLLWPAITGAAGAVTSFILGINVAPIIALAGTIWGAAAAVGGFMLAAAPFIIAAAAVGAAGYAIYKNWEPLKELFSDIGQLWGAVKETFGSPLESVKYAGQWWGKELGIGGGGGPALGAAAAAPPPTASRTTNDAKVTIDIPNLPRGARVTTDPAGTAPVDLSMGYSMVGG